MVTFASVARPTGYLDHQKGARPTDATPKVWKRAIAIGDTDTGGYR